MNNIITLIEKKQEARVSSLVLAEHLQIQHKNVLASVDQYRSDFEKLGTLAFETRKSGGMPIRFALLNEDQSYTSRGHACGFFMIISCSLPSNTIISYLGQPFQY
ncbi:MAG: hypothetical protein QX199_18315 [Methylococcaceae bacterium]